MANEFEEITHSGGIIELTLHVDDLGNKGISFGWRNSRPVPMALIGYYVLHPGVVIESLPFGGIGAPFPEPSIPGCIPMLMGSDSEGMFGHNCPHCSGYWRSEHAPNFCPYCGTSAGSEQFLSEAQRHYAAYYCEKWSEAVSQIESGTIEINLDEVADATIGKVEKPAFYISDERQQTQLKCTSCGEFNDILGRFGHCSSCFTRNDLIIFEREVVAPARECLSKGESAERPLKDLVSGFEVLVKSYLKALSNHVPLTPERRGKANQDNYSPNTSYRVFLDVFGIDIRKGIAAEQVELHSLLHARRHVFEHNGGVVDQKYLDQTGDESVKLLQKITQAAPQIFELANVLLKSAENIHAGFHSIFPAKQELIEYYRKRQELNPKV